MSEITVVVADDHPLFRKGLIDVLRADASVRVVGEASDGEAALALIRSQKPAIAILDLDMPRRNGFEVARSVRAELPAVEIVFLTMHAEREALAEAVELGAKGYVSKESAAGDVVACIHMVASGRPYVSAALTEHLLPRKTPAPTPARPAGAVSLDGLTDTERRVLQLIAQGKSSKEISAALGASPKTVENHRSNICHKLNLRGTNALTRYALEHRDALL